MNPVWTEDCNVIYKGSPQGRVGDLRCHRVMPHHIRVTYEFTPEELEVIQRGGRIQLHILKEPIPPVALVAVTKEESEPFGEHGWRIDVEPGEPGEPGEPEEAKEERDGEADDTSESEASGSAAGEALGQATETGAARTPGDDVPTSNGDTP